jgi:hypothetical protein
MPESGIFTLLHLRSLHHERRPIKEVGYYSEVTRLLSTTICMPWLMICPSTSESGRKQAIPTAYAWNLCQLESQVNTCRSPAVMEQSLLQLCQLLLLLCVTIKHHLLE